MNKVEELIKRDTLIKKIYDENGWPICPSCKRIIGDGDFCRYCGQRVDNKYGTELR